MRDLPEAAHDAGERDGVPSVSGDGRAQASEGARPSEPSRRPGAGGLTRAELEALLGLSRFRLHLIEEGEKRVRPITARRVAAAVGKTVDGLSTTAPTAGNLAFRMTTAGEGVSALSKVL